MPELCTKYLNKMYKVYPDIEKICITDQDPFYDATILSKKEIIKKLIKVTGGCKNNSHVRFKEFCAWIYLSKNPYTLFMDIDIYWNKPFEFTDKIGIYGNDECCMWNGAHPEYFKKAFDNRRNDFMLNGCTEYLPNDRIDLSKYCTHKQLNKKPQRRIK